MHRAGYQGRQSQLQTLAKSCDQTHRHLYIYLLVYNLAGRLKTLKGVTAHHYRYESFSLDPIGLDLT